jgi:hypothetical protein
VVLEAQEKRVELEIADGMIHQEVNGVQQREFCPKMKSVDNEILKLPPFPQISPVMNSKRSLLIK